MKEPVSFLGFPVEILSMLGTVSTTIVVLLGTLVAIHQLRTIKKQQSFEAYAKFMEGLEATRNDREVLFTLISRSTDWRNPPRKHLDAALNVMNFLNQTAMLIDEKRLPCRVVLKLFHTSWIRCWYQLEPFAAHTEQISGTRYGRLVKKMSDRAKAFHDTRPMQRGHTIFLYDDTGKRTAIYTTARKEGFAGVLQRARWRLKWTFRRY